MNRDIFFLIFIFFCACVVTPLIQLGHILQAATAAVMDGAELGTRRRFFFSGRSRAGTSTRRTENDLFDDDDGGGDAGHSTMTDAARARTKNVKSNFKKWKKKLPIHRRRREMTVRHVLVGDVFGRRPFARRGLDLKP